MKKPRRLLAPALLACLTLVAMGPAPALAYSTTTPFAPWEVPVTGFTYLKANGILFHTWNNPRYDSDLKRNTTLWSTVRSIVSKVRAGTF